MPTLYSIICKNCHSPFTAIPKYKNKKFCNPICFREYTKNHEILDNCLMCNTPLNRNLQKKFCSLSCSAIYSNQQRSKDSRAKQKDTLIKTLSLDNKLKSNDKEIYYANCSFKYWPKNVWHNLPGFELISIIGMFHPIKNPNGAVRDHIISKNYGWKNSIDPTIISHPANCQIISNYQNIKKGARSDLSIVELTERINNWKL